jgi:hypothetical protein
MKKLLTIAIILLMSTKCFAGRIYVATTGNNTTGNGTVGNEFLTVGHAVSLSAAGDSIMVGVGTFDFAATVNLPLGVSVIGSGTGTLITSTSISGNYNSLFFLSSAAGTSGNQRLENFAIDGNSRVVWVGIRTTGRSNVTVKKITATNFNFCAFSFNSQGSLFGDDNRDPGDFDIHLETVTYSLNNTVDSCNTSNCSGYENWDGTAFYGSGHIWFCGQDSFTISNHYGVQNQRAVRRNGWIFKSQSWTKNVNIYNSYFESAPYPYLTNGDASADGAQYWNFFGEMFFTSAMRFTNNICKGSLDINKPLKRMYTYGLIAKHNTFGRDAISGNQENGIILEYDVNNIIIDSNTMKYVAEAVSFSPRLNSLVDNITITKNLFHNIGQTSTNFKSSVFFSHDQGQPYNMQNIFIKKNTFSANNASELASGIIFSNIYTGTVNNVVIEDNILEKFGEYSITSLDGSKLTNVTIRNNLFYQNGTDIKWGNFAGNSAPPNAPYISTPNFTGNPLFDGNYGLQAGSPAINNATDGTNIGHTSTGSSTDVTPPTVTSTNPTNTATGVPVGAYNVIITFNEAMNTSTLNGTNITGVSGTITAGSTYASIAATLAASTTYTITVAGVQDAAGNTIAAPYVFTFTTAAAPAAGGGQKIITIIGKIL